MRKSLMVACMAAGSMVVGCVTTKDDQVPLYRIPKRSETPSDLPVAKGTMSTDPRSSQLNTDPCATALHDLGGPLLIYYSINRKLPPTLDALRQSPAWEEGMSLFCPANKLPYIYDPAGISIGGNRGRAILYDPVPAHNGVRWALTIIEPEGQGPLQTKVIVLPESSFKKAP